MMLNLYQYNDVSSTHTFFLLINSKNLLKTKGRTQVHNKYIREAPIQKKKRNQETTSPQHIQQNFPIDMIKTFSKSSLPSTPGYI